MSREAFYTYLRRLLGRGFTQAEVDDLEAHIDAMIAAGDMPSATPDTKLAPFNRESFLTRFANTNARAIEDVDIIRAAARLGVTPAHIRAIIKVESGGKSYDDRGRPIILFEPHIFHRRTEGRWSPSSFSYAKWRSLPYPRTFDARWAQMADAADCNFDVALESASWGLFQVMGFHWKALGFANVVDMIETMVASEAGHLDVVCRFIEANGLAKKLAACRRGDPTSCIPFVKAYNGAGFAKNNYHRKFARAL